MRVRAAVCCLALLVMLAGCQADVQRQVILTEAAPSPVGPYSQGVVVGDTLYVSGQLGMDPATGTLVKGIESQTRQALENIRAVLEAAGFEPADVVQCQVLLEDIDDYARMNRVYAGFFPEDPPTRAAFEVAELPLDAEVEILAVAVR